MVLVLHLRQENNLGSHRIQNELKRQYQISLSLATIHKVLVQNNVKFLWSSKREKQILRYPRPTPRHRVIHKASCLRSCPRKLKYCHRAFFCLCTKASNLRVVGLAICTSTLCRFKSMSVIFNRLHSSKRMRLSNNRNSIPLSLEASIFCKTVVAFLNLYSRIFKKYQYALLRIVR